ncbi:hypothetical protein QR680_004367 [Steinernema hermaphroditum]|uniref:Uncharacterized protein n=1 Tax=Steinernema hermaphroditum TaxID=289476 RepID=A0AA39HNH9_9BILA|nr:hypothetical protein QR680_004367 [Steinernema hermaphroditum]
MMSDLVSKADTLATREGDRLLKVPLRSPAEEICQVHCFNRNVAKEDTELLDELEPRPKLAAVINAAYYFEMPDFIHMYPLQCSAPSTNLIRRMLKTPRILR